MGQSIYILRNEIVAVGKRTYDRGYVASNDGNISARIDEKRVLITPTGVSKGFMKPEDLIVVDYNGKVLAGIKKEDKINLEIISNIELDDKSIKEAVGAKAIAKTANAKHIDKFKVKEKEFTIKFNLVK